MSQHDYNLANADGATFRSDANSALQAIAECNSGATAPSTTFAYQLWADTANDLLKQRNAANSAWITLFTLSDPSATATQEGIIELATTAEINTGTDATRAVTPDNLSASYAGKKEVELIMYAVDGDSETGNGKAYFTIPSTMNGMDLLEVAAELVTAGTTGTQDIQIHNLTQAADMLSTKLTIDSGETSSTTAATPAVIDTANDDVATNDRIRIDIDAIHTTAGKGASVRMVFGLP